MKIQILVLLILSLQVVSQFQSPTIVIQNKEILTNQEVFEVMKDGQLNEVYDDTIYNNILNCENGYLNIINNTKGNNIIFQYSGFGPLNPLNTQINISPNKEPSPYISSYSTSNIVLSFNCSHEKDIENYDADNYFNKIDLQMLNGKYKISFLLNCDPDNRHKQFQYGYLILAVLNACILVGVALHSQVWSLKINGRRLGVNIRSLYVLIFLLIVVAVSLILYFAAFRDFQTAFVGLHYFGIVFSYFFVFVCFNEIYYLFKLLRYSLYRKFRVCQFLSLITATVIIITAFFVDNWIYHNLVSICICVASIKIFHFSSLKEAYITQLIVIAIFTTLTAVIHFLEPDRSYNDYATELSSPLFLVVPDLVNNLFKKCSWMFILDIIVPGVMLSYLRLYDLNRGSKFVGVYTLVGNITVVIGTILWVALEYAYPFSVPFSLVTYLCLMVIIFVLSWTRNEFKDLWSGMFEKENSVIDESRLSEKHRSFGDLVPDDLIDPLKRISQSAEEGNSAHSDIK